MSGSSEGVGPGSGVFCAFSTLSCASLLALVASEYPSGRDHQLRHAHVFAAVFACFVAGSGGNGGSSTRGSSEGGASSAGGVSSGFGLGASSTMPSVETLICVIEAGITSPLLDLRLVRKCLGESSRDLFAPLRGSSPVEPEVTPMLSVAVLTMAGAFDRQLPVPDSHFLPLGVCVPGVVGGVALLADAVEAASDLTDEGAFGKIPLAFGVLEGVLATSTSLGTSDLTLLLSAAGALVFSFAFLRGIIPMRLERGKGSR